MHRVGLEKVLVSLFQWKSYGIAILGFQRQKNPISANIVKRRSRSHYLTRLFVPVRASCFITPWGFPSTCCIDLFAAIRCPVIRYVPELHGPLARIYGFDRLSVTCVAPLRSNEDVSGAGHPPPPHL